jgi:hypothetical protein
LLKVTEYILRFLAENTNVPLHTDKGPHKDEGIFIITGDFIWKEITLFFFPICSNNLSNAKSPNIYNFDI